MKDLQLYNSSHNNLPLRILKKFKNEIEEFSFSIFK
jgi:hypothetical protein